MKALIDRWNSRKSDSKYLTRLVSSIQKNPPNHELAQITHDSVFKEMDCLQCANCCKSIPPIVSMRDAKRIAKRLNISKKVFLDTYTLLDEDGDLVINASPCPFLLEDNKCRIYEDRPAACRLYPHSGEELFYKNLSHHKRNARYCPALLEILKRIAQQH